MEHEITTTVKTIEAPIDGRCEHCGTDVQRVTGGSGPVHVHTATGFRFCTARTTTP